MWQPDSPSTSPSDTVEEQTVKTPEPRAPEPDPYDQLLLARLVDDGCPHVRDGE